VDDEHELIQKLQQFCRLNRDKVIVFFDNAAIGQSGTRSYGMVKATYVKSGFTADDAIISYLSRLGRKAKNLTVVSSDRRVIIAAKSMQANVIKSQEFANKVENPVHKHQETNFEDLKLSDEEIKEWQDIFKNGKDSSYVD
jgi:predicted RNA-binding protein with PIN domain